MAKRRYELTISTNYVPDWGIVEAFRELFQNALDNEITTPENEMEFSYDKANETVRISNKTSELEVDTLLMGSTSKADDENTIGKHGEGYKVAFMVLLREGKGIKVYNYGKREIWDARLVKSKRFNGRSIPVITVEREAFWATVPDNDLTVEVTGVNEEEYSRLVVKNLHLREVDTIEVPDTGRILTDKSEKGNIYVKGLYVCNNKSFDYGYDLEPRLINLDRDRKLVSTFDLAWVTALMWRYSYSIGLMKLEIRDMIRNNSKDTEYFNDRNYNYTESKEFKGSLDDILADDLAEDFLEEHGENVIPVMNNDEIFRANRDRLDIALVNEQMAGYIRKSTKIKIETLEEEYTIKEQFEEFLRSIEGKLTDEEVDRFADLIDKVK